MNTSEQEKQLYMKDSLTIQVLGKMLTYVEMCITHVTSVKDKFLSVIIHFNGILLNFGEPFLVSTGTLTSRSTAMLLN